MALRKIEKLEWRPFCDALTKTLTGKRVEIEVAGLAIGDQIQAEWLPLIGITYDAKDDLIEIALEGGDPRETVDHMIHRPKEMYMDSGADGLISLAIIDDEGTRQIIKLRDPLMLPSPGAARKADAGAGS